jgi:putative membrane protein
MQNAIAPKFFTANEEIIRIPIFIYCKKIALIFSKKIVTFLNCNLSNFSNKQNYIMKIFKFLTKSAICFAVSTGFLSLSANAQKANKLTDPEIASVAVTANQIDIEYAKIAEKKSTNADILKFAETMAKDHQSVINQAVALATKLGVTPKTNATTKSFLAGSVKTKAMLNSKKGNAFNKAYIDNEVAYHKAAINEVENVLIPDATNGELKSLLQSALPLFKEHLAHAEMVQKEFSK